MRRIELGIVAATLVALCGCEGRARTTPSGEGGGPAKSSSSTEGVVAEFDLTRGAPEQSPSTLFGASSKRTYVDLVRALVALEPSDDAKGVFVRFGGSSFGLSRAQEIGTLLGRVKKKMPVFCHADEYNNTSIYVAAAGCTKVWVSPAGGVETVGIAAQLLYARSLFDRLKVSVDFLQVGKFKGAEEPFTRDGPSPEARASLEGTLRGLRTGWIDGIVEGRGNKAMADLVEAGPYTPEEAKKNGLVDEVGYFEEARDAVKKEAGVSEVASHFGSHDAASPMPKGLTGILRSLSGSGHSSSAHVAIVPAVGAISMAPSRSLLGGGEGISEKELGKVISKLTHETSAKAVVVRIDSPGGSALASDLLWKKLMKLREKKPLVFSIGSMAASGGYYLSCTANKIVAEPGSIVGSIGVVGGKLAFGKALEEYGIHAETVAASPEKEKAARAAYMSPFAAWDDPTRVRVLASMTAIYDLFLARVAEGRGTTVAAIAPSAEGRIFGGVEAKERKLIDELGGFDDAVKLAEKLADLPEDTPLEVVTDQPGLVELLEPGEDDGDDESRAALAFGSTPVAAAMRETLEHAPELAALAGSMTPLLQGERALTALPFGLSVR